MSSCQLYIGDRFLAIYDMISDHMNALSLADFTRNKNKTNTSDLQRASLDLHEHFAQKLCA